MYVILHCLTKQIKPYKNHNCKKLLFAEKFCSTLSNKIVCIILMPEANYIYRLIILVPSYIFVCDDQFPYMHSISRKITPKIEGGFVVMREIIGQFNFT